MKRLQEKQIIEECNNFTPKINKNSIKIDNYRKKFFFVDGEENIPDESDEELAH